MTTIVCDRNEIAADSQETYDNTKTFSSKKLFRVEREDGELEIVATAGDSFAGMKFLQWYEGSEFQDPCTPELQINDTLLFDWDDDFHILVWNKQGLYEVNRYFKLIEVREKFHAVGSGAAVALGAMHMKATPTEAVQIAKKVDLYTGGKVITMELC
tara:strand:- start:149 stop:619 length:471 start_codon:yes stop_codon:yes gene_type:complete